MKTLKDIQVKNQVEVTTEMLEMLKNTQEFGKRYFNEQPYSIIEMQNSIYKMEKTSNVIKYTDGQNVLIAVNNKIWDGVSMLSR